MALREQILYTDLPLSFRQEIAEPKLLKAYGYGDEGTIVAWILSSSHGQQQEIEFSVKEDRFLSRHERQSALPPSEEFSLPEMRLTVLRGYRLEPNTDVRYETYVAFSQETGGKVAECEQIYFAPSLSAADQLIRSALRAAAWPAEYQALSVSDRVSYWSSALYRLRHQTGEMGAKEDEVFGVDLIEKMKSFDADIAHLLPSVISRLAKAEGIDPAALLSSFNARTGVSLKLLESEQ